MAMFNSYVSLPEGIPFSVDSVVPHIYMLEVGPWSNLYEWPWTYMKLLNYINTILLINHIYLWINYVRASIYTYYLTIYIYTIPRWYSLSSLIFCESLVAVPLFWRTPTVKPLPKIADEHLRSCVSQSVGNCAAERRAWPLALGVVQCFRCVFLQGKERIV